MTAKIRTVQYVNIHFVTKQLLFHVKVYHLCHCVANYTLYWNHFHHLEDAFAFFYTAQVQELCTGGGE